MDTQKRRHPRAMAPKGLVVAWQVGSKRTVSYLNNIGLGGVFIRTTEPPPVESTVKLLINASVGDVEARAVVRSVSPEKGMGVEFVAMPPESRARLAQLLRPLLQSPA